MGLLSFIRKSADERVIKQLHEDTIQDKIKWAFRFTAPDPTRHSLISVWEGKYQGGLVRVKLASSGCECYVSLQKKQIRQLGMDEEQILKTKKLIWESIIRQKRYRPITPDPEVDTEMMSYTIERTQKRHVVWYAETMPDLDYLVFVGHDWQNPRTELLYMCPIERDSNWILAVGGYRVGFLSKSREDLLLEVIQRSWWKSRRYYA